MKRNITDHIHARIHLLQLLLDDYQEELTSSSTTARSLTLNDDMLKIESMLGCLESQLVHLDDRKRFHIDIVPGHPLRDVNHRVHDRGSDKNYMEVKEEE